MPGVGQVVFQIDGIPIVVPSSDGRPLVTPVSRDDYVSLTTAGIACAVRCGPPLLGHIDFSTWHRLGSWLANKTCEPKEIPSDLARRMTVRKEGS